MADKIIKAAKPSAINEFSKPQPPEDPLDRNRRIFTKGRFEWMGGPKYSIQGNNIEIDEMNYDSFQMEKRNLENQDRCPYSSPTVSRIDPSVEDLGVDSFEQ